MIQIILISNGIRVANIDYPNNHLVFGIERSIYIEIFDSGKKVVSAPYTEFLNELSQPFLTPEAVITALELSYVAIGGGDVTQAELDLEISERTAADIAINNDLTILKNNEYKITYYEIVSGTSGSLTIPTNSTINSDEFGLSGNAILSKIDGSNKPMFESPKTVGGVVVTATLNPTTGAWVASGIYTDATVALIYSIKIKAVYYSNLTYSRIIETVDLGSSGVQSVTGAQVDNTDPLNPVVNKQTNLVSIDDNTFVSVNNNLIEIKADDGSDAIAIGVTPTTFTKNGVEIATINDIPSLTGYEQTSNKATDWTVINDTLYPTVKSVDTQIKGIISSSLSFFFYKTASDIGTYYKMLQTPSTGGAQTITVINTTGTTSLGKFITELGSPNKLYIPVGWNRIHIHASKTGAGNVTLFGKIYKRNLAGTETLLFTTVPTVTNLTTSPLEYNLEYYNTSIVTLLSTDRIIFEPLSITASGSPDVILTIEDATLGRIDMPGATQDLSNLVPYTGATSNVNLGNYNLSSKNLITPKNSQTNTLTTYTIDLSLSNIILFTASSNCVLSFSNAIQGQYTIIIDNSGLYTLTLALTAGWYTNLAAQPNLTGLVYITCVYDGARLFINEIESMQQVIL
jgi:hypothetical protein